MAHGVSKLTTSLIPKGGTFNFDGRLEEKVKDAIESFVTNEKRHEAALVSAFRHSMEDGEPKVCTGSLF